MRMMRKMWCDVIDEKYEFGPWVFVQGRPVVQQPGCGCTILHPCSKPSSSRWPCGTLRRALVCMVVVVPGILKFDDLNLTIWHWNIMHFFCAADKALSCTPQTNRVFICCECAALYTRCRVVPSPLTPLLSSAAPRSLRRRAVQPYVRTSEYNRLCFADCRHCRSTK